MKMKTSIKEEKWNVSDAVKTEKLIIPISIILYPIVNKELKFMFWLFQKPKIVQMK